MAFPFELLHGFSQGYMRNKQLDEQKKLQEAKEGLLSAQTSEAEAQAQAIPGRERDRSAMQQLQMQRLRQQMSQAPAPKAADFSIQKGGDGTLYQVNKITGQASPVSTDGKPLKGYQSRGMTVMGPDGKPILQIGGSQTPSSLARSGGVVTDAQGNKVLMPGSASRTKLFNSISASQQIAPSFNKLQGYSNSYPYFGSHMSYSWADKAANIFGLGKDKILGGRSADDRMAYAADSEAEASGLVDGVIKTYGLNVTDNTIDSWTKRLTQKPGQNRAAYDAGVNVVKQEMLGRIKIAMSQARGIQLDNSGGEQ